MIHRRFFTELDYPLLAAVLALAALGLLGVYSATAASGTQFQAHLVRLGLGLAACLVFACIDYHRLAEKAFLLYGTALLVLLATLLFGSVIKGSKSWLVLMGFSFQPSELAKLAVILVLARFLGNLPSNYLSSLQIAQLGLLSAMPVLLVVLQGDVGTALMYLPILGGMMLVAGLRWRVVLVMALALALLAPGVWFVLLDRHRDRLLVTLNPDLDPQGVGYQVRQSRIAIGSGGFLGKGLGDGQQSQLGFVPEIHTDFIFALLGEEVGFLGTATLLLLFLFVLMRILNTAEVARDRTGLLAAAGVASMYFAHFFTNVGMTLGLMPAIGVPLPFVSYGGSAILTMFAALGLVLNIRYRRFIYD